MILSILFLVSLVLLVYLMLLTIRNDHKKTLLHRLSYNHAKMLKLYRRLEEIVFLRGDATTGRKIPLSYDLYLAGIKKQSALYDKEMEELRNTKLNSDQEQHYLKIIGLHEFELSHLQSEIRRLERRYLR